MITATQHARDITMFVFRRHYIATTQYIPSEYVTLTLCDPAWLSLSLFLSRSRITLAKCQLEELIWAICIADPEKEEPSLKSHSLAEARASQQAPQEGGHRRYCWKSTLFVDAASRATERRWGARVPSHWAHPPPPLQVRQHSSTDTDGWHIY